MAKFISIKSSGSGIAGGDILVGVDLITGVEQASATTVVIYLAGGAAGDFMYYYSQFSWNYSICKRRC